MNPYIDHAAFERSINRRSFLGRSAYGLGEARRLLEFAFDPAKVGGPRSNRSLAAIVGRAVQRPVNPLHFPVKARRIIHLCMAGGPSQFDTFDWKPELTRLDGQPFPESFTGAMDAA